MTDVHSTTAGDCPFESNITTRKIPGAGKSKMALSNKTVSDLGHDGSLLIDSILSQDEEFDIITMLNTANELEGGLKLPSFYTSSQMGGKTQSRRPRSSPPLSPIITGGVDSKKDLFYPINDTLLLNEGEGARVNKNHELIDQFTRDQPSMVENNNPELSGEMPIPVTGACVPAEIRDGSNDANLGVAADPVPEEVVDPVTDPVTGALGPHFHDVRGKQNTDDEDNSDDELPAGGREIGSDSEDPADIIEHYSDPKNVAAKLLEVDSILKQLGGNSARLGNTVKDLQTSLEYSQKEVDELKRENQALKLKMGTIELEDRRTQFQIKSVDDKLDKLETTSKRKNLLFEGIREQDGRKEDVDKIISDLFDQMNVTTGVSIEACYRVGPYNRSRPRPILVSFEKQVDREMIYSKRTELRGTTDFQRVWVNEDLGQASKRKRGLIRLITKEAELQGIDCRSGKYALHINRVKYDDSNLDELPPQLQPTSLKQVQIDKETLVYQSEFAPFSNFYPCHIVAGQHTFFCLEQAFQFLKAKFLNKPLAATKIYLSRDVRFIKQIGAELGTTEEWEGRQFDIMYLCLLKKFLQHPDLRALLLGTGNLVLVEATPDRLWGCGATLSSNALRRHEWPGNNKHGQILMTVREELRRRDTK